MIAYDATVRCSSCGAIVGVDATVTASSAECFCRSVRIRVSADDARRAKAEKAAKMALLRQREEWLKRKGDRSLRKGQK